MRPGPPPGSRSRLDKLHRYEARGWEDRLRFGEGARCPFPAGHLAAAWVSGAAAAVRYLAVHRARYLAAKKALLEGMRQGGLEDLRRRLEQLRRGRPAA